MIIDLHWWQLAIPAGLVAALAATTWLLHLGIGRSLVINAARMMIQLTLLGLILEWVFALDRPLVIVAIALVMLAVAGNEVLRRQKHRLRGLRAYAVGTTAMGVSSFAVTCFLLVAVIRPEPLWRPQYAIPLLGMLLGNTMNGIALALERLSSSLVDQRARVEGRLLLGQTPAQAIAGQRRDAMRAGMIPTINGMAIAGVVSLPGMMTGQILAGNDPTTAVEYQILIFLAIAIGAGFGTILAVHLVGRSLFDHRDRLRLDRLRTEE